MFALPWIAGLVCLLAAFTVRPRSQAPIWAFFGVAFLVVAAVLTYFKLTEPARKAQEKKEKEFEKQKNLEKMQERFAHKEGLQKYYEMDVEDARNYQEAIKAIRELGVIMQKSVYQEKEKDWAVLGGIAEGIGGPIAGIATALNAMHENEGIKARNQERKEWASQQRAFYQDLARNAAKQTTGVTTLRDLEKKYMAVMAWSPLTLFSLLRFSQTSAEIDSITGAVTVNTNWSQADTSLVIDGALRAKLYTAAGKLAGCAYLVLPKSGTVDFKGKLSGICVNPEPSHSYSVRIEPINLWEFASRANSVSNGDHLTLTAHRNVVMELEKSYQFEAEQRKQERSTEKESEKKQAHEQNKRQKREDRKRLKKRLTLFVVALFIAAVLVATPVLIMRVAIPAIRYHEAMELRASGKLDEALVAFSSIGSFKDSTKYVTEISYLLAKQRISEGQLREAYMLLSSVIDYEDSQALRAQLENEHPYLAILRSAPGDIVTLGEYEQNNKKSDGTEPIEWIVLYNDSGNVYLLSKKVLDVHPFNETDLKKCSLDIWLKGTFSDNAFNTEEAEIVTRVGLLHVNDIEKYDIDALQRQAKYTDYALAKEPEQKASPIGLTWWLTSDTLYAGLYHIYAPAVWENSQYDDSSCEVTFRGGVRPAVWLFVDEYKLPAEPEFDGSTPSFSFSDETPNYNSTPSGGSGGSRRYLCRQCSGDGKTHDWGTDMHGSGYTCSKCGGDGWIDPED